MALVSRKGAALALAAVAHIPVAERDAPVGRDAFADLRLAAPGRLRVEVLLPQLPERCEHLRDRRLSSALAQLLAHPLFERRDRRQQARERLVLLRLIGPVGDIERALDAPPEEQLGADPQRPKRLHFRRSPDAPPNALRFGIEAR